MFNTSSATDFITLMEIEINGNIMRVTEVKNKTFPANSKLEITFNPAYTTTPYVVKVLAASGATVILESDGWDTSKVRILNHFNTNYKKLLQ